MNQIKVSEPTREDMISVSADASIGTERTLSGTLVVDKIQRLTYNIILDRKDFLLKQFSLDTQVIVLPIGKIVAGSRYYEERKYGTDPRNYCYLETGRGRIDLKF